MSGETAVEASVLGKLPGAYVVLAVLGFLLIVGIRGLAEVGTESRGAACAPGEELLERGLLAEAETSFIAVINSTSSDDDELDCAGVGLAAIAELRCEQVRQLASGLDSTDAGKLLDQQLAALSLDTRESDCTGLTNLQTPAFERINRVERSTLPSLVDRGVDRLLDGWFQFHAGTTVWIAIALAFASAFHWTMRALRRYDPGVVRLLAAHQDDGTKRSLEIEHEFRAAFAEFGKSLNMTQPAIGKPADSSSMAVSITEVDEKTGKLVAASRAILTHRPEFVVEIAIVDANTLSMALTGAASIPPERYGVPHGGGRAAADQSGTRHIPGCVPAPPQVSIRRPRTSLADRERFARRRRPSCREELAPMTDTAALHQRARYAVYLLQRAIRRHIEASAEIERRATPERREGSKDAISVGEARTLLRRRSLHRAQLHVDLASAFERLHQWSNAERHYCRAAQLDPEHFGAHYRHAITLGRTYYATEHRSKELQLEVETAFDHILSNISGFRYHEGKGPDETLVQAVQAARAIYQTVGNVTPNATGSAGLPSAEREAPALDTFEQREESAAGPHRWLLIYNLATLRAVQKHHMDSIPGPLEAAQLKPPASVDTDAIIAAVVEASATSDNQLTTSSLLFDPWLTEAGVIDDLANALPPVDNSDLS